MTSDKLDQVYTWEDTIVEDSAAMRRRLRVELRRQRARAKMTQRDVANALDWSPSKVIRIENGQVGISVTDLRALVAHYGLKDEGQIADLIELARGSRRQPYSEYRDILPPETIRFFGYESSASLIRHVQPLIMPGLLQTEDYTRSLLQVGYSTEPEVINRIIESRRERQEALDRDSPPDLFVVLDEAVLRRQIGGPSVMKRQLSHLLRAATRPNISIQILAFSVGANEALQGPFSHLEFPDGSDPDVLFLENARGGPSFIDDPEVTVPFQETFIRLEDLAAPPGALSEFVDLAIKTFDG